MICVAKGLARVAGGIRYDLMTLRQAGAAFVSCTAEDIIQQGLARWTIIQETTCLELWAGLESRTARPLECIKLKQHILQIQVYTETHESNQLHGMQEREGCLTRWSTA